MNEIHSFLMVGQSNMAGRGYLNAFPPYDNTHLRVLRNGKWQPMYRPVNNDRAFSGISLAETFAYLYAQTYGVDVGLIPCADGGTAIAEWQEGQVLFDHAAFQAGLAARSSTVKGILWHQGETDCKYDSYETYEEKLRAVISGFRKSPCLQKVPFLIGGLGEFLDPGSYHFAVGLNEMMQKIANTTELCGYVSSEGLPSNEDHLHFSAEACREFGTRYFHVYQTIMGEKTSC